MAPRKGGMAMGRLTGLCLLVVLAVLPLSCGVAAEKPGVGDSVVDFELKGLDGKAVKTEEARKDKVFLLKFGASWCVWCNRQVPHLNKVTEEYKDKVAVLDVDVKEEADKVREHNKKVGTKYTTLLDPDGKASAQYAVRGIPVVIVADKAGKVAYRGYYTDYAKLKEVIDGLLKTEK